MQYDAGNSRNRALPLRLSPLYGLIEPDQIGIFSLIEGLKTERTFEHTWQKVITNRVIML
jgi:hypothetical protein